MSALGFKSDGLKELWSRLRFVLLAIIIYRIGTHIPVPGIDPLKISSLFDQNQGTLLGLFNMFSGGALESCLLYTSPSPRDPSISRMPSSA